MPMPRPSPRPPTFFPRPPSVFPPPRKTRSQPATMPSIEILPTTTTRAAQPGWAYVPDLPIAAIQPPTRKRGRDGILLSNTNSINAKQQKAIDARLKELDRENYKDVSVSIPKSDRARDKNRKLTSNVRRILGYNRNFGHYLADEEAAAAGGPATAAPTVVAGGREAKRVAAEHLRESRPSTPSLSKQTSNLRGKEKEKEKEMPPPSATPKPQQGYQTSPTKSPSQARPTSSSSQTLNSLPYPPSWDQNPLLRTLHLPPTPSDRVMQLLLAEPPLSYSAARATYAEDHQGPPPRHFCVSCGHFAKLHCRKCGQRTCGLLECWRSHEAAGCGMGVA
jgi:zinc finger HIT domain-containing protein 1